MKPTNRSVWAMLGVAFLAWFASAGGTALADQPQRGMTLMPRVAPGSVPIAGEYWALIIGIDKYTEVPQLDSAVKDATGVRDVLIEKYGFRRERIVELLNEQGTKVNIEDALYQLGKKAGPNDSVLIYYAGHGQYDEDNRLAWWVPVDGKPQKPGSFVPNAAIRDYIEGMQAKHVYLVADSCFSGTLFGKLRALPPLTDQFFSRLQAKKSRWGLTSGGTEPVADQGKSGHSIFAYHFINLLRDNTDPYLVPSHIFDQLAPIIANNAEQTPRSEPLKGTGDEGGQFVFRLASAKGAPTAKPKPGISGESRGNATEALEAERQHLAAERQRLQDDREVMDQEKRQAEERRRAEQRAKAIEEARVRPFDAPRQEDVAAKDVDVQVQQTDPAGCTWVESKAHISFGEHDTKHQAMAQAISEARAKAIEGFLGVKVENRFLDFQQESSLKGQVSLTESLLRVTQLGRVLKEERLRSGPADAPGCPGCRFIAHIRACIVPLPEHTDRGFKVDASLNRTRFADGDEGQIQIATSRDAYIYMYSVDVNWDAALLFPNAYATDNLVKAGQVFVFPSEDLKKRGVKVKARLPAGTTASAEMIRVIASKEPLPPTVIDPAAKDVARRDAHATSETGGAGTFLNLIHKLNATQTEWVEDAQAFTIYKK